MTTLNWTKHERQGYISKCGTYHIFSSIREDLNGHSKGWNVYIVATDERIAREQRLWEAKNMASCHANGDNWMFES